MKTHLAILATLALAAAGCSEKQQQAPSQEPEEVAVTSVKVDSVTLTKQYPGHLTAAQKVDIQAQVSGYLTSRPYQKGAFVKKGTVLFTIDDTQYRNAVVEAEAALANARATYQKNEAQYSRMAQALEKDAVSQMDVINAKSAMDIAKAQISDAEAALSTARKNLGYCTVRAPFDGHVSDATVDVGTYIVGPSQVLATIYDDSSMTANFAIEDTRYLDLVREQASASGIDLTRIPIEFNEKLPRQYTADLSYMAPAIDPTTGTMQVQATIPNPNGDLKSGMYAQVSLPYGTSPHAILVRDASIGTDQLGKYLYVVNSDNKVVYTPVEVGELLPGDSLRIVTKGLKPGDRYVTKALLKVRDGMEVRPVAE